MRFLLPMLILGFSDSTPAAILCQLHPGNHTVEFKVTRYKLNSGMVSQSGCILSAQFDQAVRAGYITEGS
jgi:hypothetical protein